MQTTRLKTCTACNNVLPVDNFHKSSVRKNGTIIYQPRCKDCYNKHYASKWHVMDQKEKAKEKFRRKEKFNSDWHKNYRLRTKYNMTLEEFNSRYDLQHGSCYICKIVTPADEIRVDHCHKSGKVRKLLCHNCNTMLGHAKEDIQVLLKAVEYIREHHDFIQEN